MTDSVRDIVLLHGWGLNRAIWNDYILMLQARWPALAIHLVDIPGYGELSARQSSADIGELTRACLDQAPESAIWVGWSLGGMIALQAALYDHQQNSQRIQGLQLINCAPKFVQAEDWPVGVDIGIFEKFCAELAADYDRTLAMFLLLQAGASKGARDLARSAQQAIQVYPQPSAQTLSMGIECLANTDLRESLCLWSKSEPQIPVQVVSGTLDRVTNPDNSKSLLEFLSAELVEIKSGHAPFLTEPEKMIDSFESLLGTFDA